jgi:SAM-dependent methyltransferase
MTQSRLDREKSFHDKAFGEHTRETVNGYYVIAQRAFTAYGDFLDAHCHGKKVLEYGCGPGSNAFRMTQHQAQVVGIDISDTAIQQAVKQADQEKLVIDFRVMNAESLDFGADFFDMACGSGILHHLDLNKAFAELARTLKPGSHAIFLEPLNHNPIIQLYRKLTPQFRTEDEHPLKVADLKLFEQYFEHLNVRYFCFTSLVMILLRKSPSTIFNSGLRLFDALDRAIFRWLPFLKRYAWIAVIEVQTAAEMPISRRA